MALQLKNGTYVPGSTTILGLLDKPFLVPWANKLGKQQIDVQEYVDQAAKQGELIHLILDSHIMKEEIDLDKYSDEEIRIGEEAFNRYMEWERNHTIEFPEVEKEQNSAYNCKCYHHQYVDKNAPKRQLKPID